jgi:hypothetical protein
MSSPLTLDTIGHAAQGLRLMAKKADAKVAETIPSTSKGMV